MQSTKKRFSTESPRKIQIDMSLFTGKCSNNKNTPNKSYAQVTADNRFKALSDPDEEKDEEMENIFTSNSSDTTPKQGNATTKDSSDTLKVPNLSNPLSKKSQIKLAKASRKSSSVNASNMQYLSSATRATLEQARKAKENLVNTTNKI
jgi:hypothetical protein